jgi:hypothetical protein
VDWQLFCVICLVLGTFIAILAHAEVRNSRGILGGYGSDVGKDAHPRQAA